MPQSETVFHPFEPVWDENSKVLILGSIPSPASRGAGFYYGQPQNRFWRVLAAVFETPLPESVEEKKKLLLVSGVALWDVLASCEIEGAKDSTIKEPEPNDVAGLLSNVKISKVLLNGQKAGALYEKYCAPGISVPHIRLPSTSPANAAWNLGALVEAWGAALK